MIAGRNTDPPPLHTQVETLLTSTSSAGRSWSSFSFIREKHEFGFDPVNVRELFPRGRGFCGQHSCIKEEMVDVNTLLQVSTCYSKVMTSH